MIDWRVSMAQIILYIKRVDLPPVGEEYCCNRMLCSKLSLQLYGIVKHHWGVINDSWSLETEISIQTWEFPKSENHHKITTHQFPCLAKNRCPTVIQKCQFSIVKHHGGVLNESWSLEAEISTQTWEFRKCENPKMHQHFRSQIRRNFIKIDP